MNRIALAPKTYIRNNSTFSVYVISKDENIYETITVRANNRTDFRNSASNIIVLDKKEVNSLNYRLSQLHLSEQEYNKNFIKESLKLQDVSSRCILNEFSEQQIDLCGRRLSLNQSNQVVFTQGDISSYDRFIDKNMKLENIKECDRHDGNCDGYGYDRLMAKRFMETEYYKHLKDQEGLRVGSFVLADTENEKQDVFLRLDYKNKSSEYLTMDAVTKIINTYSFPQIIGENGLERRNNKPQMVSSFKIEALDKITFEKVNANSLEENLKIAKFTELLDSDKKELYLTVDKLEKLLNISKGVMMGKHPIVIVGEVLSNDLRSFVIDEFISNISDSNERTGQVLKAAKISGTILENSIKENLSENIKDKIKENVTIPVDKIKDALLEEVNVKNQAKEKQKEEQIDKDVLEYTSKSHNHLEI